MTAQRRPAEGIFRDMLVLASGAGAAKAVALLSTPIVTRLYAPEQLGALALFLAALVLLTPLTSLRYSAALPLPRRDETAGSIALLSCMWLLIFCMTCGVVLSVFAAQLVPLLRAQALARDWPLLILALLCTGAYEILGNWALRKRVLRSSRAAERVRSGRR